MRHCRRRNTDAEGGGWSSAANDHTSNNSSTGGNGSPSSAAHLNGNTNGAGSRNGNTVIHPRTAAHRRPTPALRTVISSGVTIKGTAKFRSEAEIDGNVEGTIESLGRLTVGKNGHVRGDIQGRSVTVHGTVDGNLSVGEKCELRAGCTLRGDIETSRLVVDENVNFTGSAAIATRDYLAELRPINGNSVAAD